MNSRLLNLVRLPALVRAPVSALLILMAAVYPTSFLFQINLNFLPILPWRLVPGGLYLWLLWHYIGGRGIRAATNTRREHYRRYRPLPRTGKLWVWLSAAGLGLTLLSYAMIKLLTETGGVQQTAVLDALAPLPAITVLPLLALLVLMTAFFEEAAFRGYMQVQLEERYRPSVAIFLTALLFAGVHFPTLEQLPLFIFGSMGWGLLTYLSRTIIPAIVAHAMVDAVVFFWAWANPDEFATLLQYNALKGGPNFLFMTTVAVALVATVFTGSAFWLLCRHRRDNRIG